MSRPVVHQISEEIYEALEPFARLDEATDWHLLKYIEAFAGSMLGTVHAIVNETDDQVGWSVLFDPDLAPVEALPYLAQFVGAVLPESMTESEKRSEIKNPSGFERGTLAALERSVARTLTGSKIVIVDERYTGSAYQLRVRTIVSETPDPTLSEAAAVAQKPVGIVLTYLATTGQDWGDVVSENADWDAVLAGFDTWADLIAEPPP